jgi:hypothetical protein
MDDDERQARIFTLQEARDLLPMVRILFARLKQAHVAAAAVSAKLEELERQRTRANTLTLARPLRERREELGEQVERLREIIGQIEALGVDIKSLDPALIDFPSLRDGRVVYLCWQEGEETIAYWHELHTGFAGRRPL